MEGVQCIICAEGFDCGPNAPLTVTCGHTFCAQCVQMLIRENYCWNCPMCRNRELGRTIRNRDYNVCKFFTNAHFKINNSLLDLIGHNRTKKCINGSNTLECDKIQKFAVDKLEPQVDKYAKVINTRPNNLKNKDFYFIPNNSEIEFVNCMIHKLNDKLDRYSKKKSENEVIVSQIDKCRTIMSNWLDEKDTEADSFNGVCVPTICETTEQFIKAERWSQKICPNQVLQKEEQKLLSAPKTELINDPFNLTALGNILKVMRNINNLHNNDVLYYTSDTELNGYAYKKDDCYYLTTNYIGTVPDDALTLPLDSFNNLLNNHYINIFFDVEINKRKHGPVKMRFFGNYITFKDIVDSCVGNILLGSLCFQVCESKKDAVFRVRKDSNWSPLNLGEDDEDTENDVRYVYKHGLINYSDIDDEFQICLSDKRSSSCRNPVGEVCEGMNHLQEMSVAILKNEDVKLLSRGIILSNNFRKGSEIKRIFNKNLRFIKKAVKIQCTDITEEDAFLCNIFE